MESYCLFFYFVHIWALNRFWRKDYWSGVCFPNWTGLTVDRFPQSLIKKFEMWDIKWNYTVLLFDFVGKWALNQFWIQFLDWCMLEQLSRFNVEVSSIHGSEHWNMRYKVELYRSYCLILFLNERWINSEDYWRYVCLTVELVNCGTISSSEILNVK